MNKKIKANVNKIIPFSAVDGPGNRMAIFLQGCNFNCLNCHNPETINPCIHCKKCVPACKFNALEVINDKVVWKPLNCTHCDKCVEACPFDSTPKTSWFSVEDIIAQIEPIRNFISGVTVSGGEATLQREFLIQLGPKIKEMGLTLFIDTNGGTDFEEDPELTDSFDMAMLDVKSANADEHKRLTNVSNKIVLKNLIFLAKIGKLHEVRTVIIPNVLDNERNVDEISKLLAKYAPSVRYKLIKYRSLGVRKNLIQSQTPSEDIMKQLENIALNNGCQNVVLI